MIEHMMQDPLIQFAAQHIPVVSMPVCPKCERLGLKTKGWAEANIMVCPYCGYNGEATHQLSTYQRDKLYR